MRRAGLQRPSGAAWIALALSCAGCVTSSHVLLSSPRPLLAPAEVRLYLEPPAGRYEQIAVVTASSRLSFAFGSQAQADLVIERLESEAAKLGANGILLQEITDEPLTAIGADVAGNTMGPRGTIDLGVGGSAFLSRRFGRAIAIYLEPDARAP